MDVLDQGIDSTVEEKAVIGSLLLDPGKVREVIPYVAPGDFGNSTLGMLYSLIVGRHTTGEPVDTISMWGAIRAHEALSKRIRSATMLTDLSADVPTAANVGYYARQVAGAGQSRRLRSAGARLTQLASAEDVDPAEKLTIARREIEAIASDYATSVDVPTLAEVLAVQDEYDWVVPGLFERMDRLVVTGGEGLGKSTLIRQIAILSAAGLHPTRFHSIDPVRVTVIDAENTERQWRRRATQTVARAAYKAGRNPAESIRLHCTGRLDVTKERDVSMIHSILDRYPTDLLVIGPLYKLTPRGLNQEDDAAQVIATLDAIRERGVVLVMEAHAGKALGGDGERNMAPRGSSALLGWPEFGVGLAWDTSMLQEGDRPTVANVKRWRGDREDGRDLPNQIRRGGFWDWMDPDDDPHIDRKAA